MIAALAISLFLVCGEPSYVYVENNGKELITNVQSFPETQVQDIKVLHYKILGSEEDILFHNNTLFELNKIGQQVTLYNSGPCSGA